MCQGPQAVAELGEWKKDGAFILNDPEASRRTYRDSLCSTIREKELVFPHSEFLSTDAAADLEQLPTLVSTAGARRRGSSAPTCMRRKPATSFASNAGRI